jgi:hypothetical protein
MPDAPVKMAGSMNPFANLMKQYDELIALISSIQTTIDGVATVAEQALGVLTWREPRVTFATMVERCRYCSPRHRMPFHSRNERSKLRVDDMAGNICRAVRHGHPHGVGRRAFPRAAVTLNDVKITRRWSWEVWSCFFAFVF